MPANKSFDTDDNSLTNYQFADYESNTYTFNNFVSNVTTRLGSIKKKPAALIQQLIKLHYEACIIRGSSSDTEHGSELNYEHYKTHITEQLQLLQKYQPKKFKKLEKFIFSIDASRLFHISLVIDQMKFSASSPQEIEKWNIKSYLINHEDVIEKFLARNLDFLARIVNGMIDSMAEVGRRGIKFDDKIFQKEKFLHKNRKLEKAVVSILVDLIALRIHPYPILRKADDPKLHFIQQAANNDFEEYYKLFFTLFADLEILAKQLLQLGVLMKSYYEQENSNFIAQSCDNYLSSGKAASQYSYAVSSLLEIISPNITVIDLSKAQNYLKIPDKVTGLSAEKWLKLTDIEILDIQGIEAPVRHKGGYPDKEKLSQEQVEILNKIIDKIFVKFSVQDISLHSDPLIKQMCARFNFIREITVIYNQIIKILLLNLLIHRHWLHYEIRSTENYFLREYRLPPERSDELCKKMLRLDKKIFDLKEIFTLMPELETKYEAANKEKLIEESQKSSSYDGQKLKALISLYKHTLSEWGIHSRSPSQKEQTITFPDFIRDLPDTVAEFQASLTKFNKHKENYFQLKEGIVDFSSGEHTPELLEEKTIIDCIQQGEQKPVLPPTAPYSPAELVAHSWQKAGLTSTAKDIPDTQQPSTKLEQADEESITIPSKPVFFTNSFIRH